MKPYNGWLRLGVLGLALAPLSFAAESVAPVQPDGAGSVQQDKQFLEILRTRYQQKNPQAPAAPVPITGSADGRVAAPESATDPGLGSASGVSEARRKFGEKQPIRR